MVRSAANALALLRAGKYKTQAERNALKAVIPLIRGSIYDIANNIRLNNAVNYLNNRGFANRARNSIEYYLEQENAAHKNRVKYALGKASIQLARLHNMVQKRRALHKISPTKRTASTAQVARRLRIIHERRKINENRNKLMNKYKNIMKG
jgi:hypothetical protein